MLFKLFEQGGPFFMTPILILFILTVVLFVKELIQKNNRERTITILKSLSAFVFVWGLCGQVIGLIEGFDSMEGIEGSVSPAILYGGLKFTFLPTLFGMVTFLFTRAYITVLQWKLVKA
ncbi:MAG: MotA/TolQ/ExbB proton channel family protein [Bacteroidota bacterium]